MSAISEKILEDRILPRVTKPGRYLGNETNVIRKPFDKMGLRIALIFPDVYEMGMSYPGFDILYHILNQQDWIAAERVYAPWVDMEEQLRSEGLNLFSLESKRPLSDFDVVGFTLQYELHFTNILNMLDLGGIPVHAEERDKDSPIVLAGGPCAFNPEPLAEFIDAFVIGDGEEVFLEVARTLHDTRKRGEDRSSLLLDLATAPGVYVPRFYEPVFDEQGRYVRLDRTIDGVPEIVKARVVDELKPEYFTAKPLVPLVEVSHDRLSLEIMRGCTRGCRFCNAGIIYRPVREREVADLLAQASNGIANSGYDEVSLVSLSTSDYEQLPALLKGLTETLKNKKVSISFPSLRPEMFTQELARFAKGVRKSGLTLAPEAGTQRLRSVINKGNTNEDLLCAVDLAFREGWNLIKLYFMIGQPTETEQDIDAIAELILEVSRAGKRYGQSCRVNVSLSPFVPKPFTPFQWEEQSSIGETQDKIRRVCHNVKSRNVNISWREPEVAFLEGVIARGDRMVGRAVEEAWRQGARFDAWSEHFDFELWQKAFHKTRLDTQQYLAAKALDSPLPWDHIDKGVSKKFLVTERLKAGSGAETNDCRQAGCRACGLMEEVACKEIIEGQPRTRKGTKHSTQIDGRYGRKKKLAAVQSPAEHSRTMRMRYRKDGQARFLSHLDVGRVFERAFARANIDLAFSQGFNPRPKISYGPALAVGYSSEAEYTDFQYLRSPSSDIVSLVAPQLPAGIEIMEMRPLYGKSQSLSSLITRADWVIMLIEETEANDLHARVEELLKCTDVLVARQKDGTTIQVDIRPFVREIGLLDSGRTLRIVTTLKNGRTARIDEILGVLFVRGETDSLPLIRVHRKDVLVEFGTVARTPLEV